MEWAVHGFATGQSGAGKSTLKKQVSQASAIDIEPKHQSLTRHMLSSSSFTVSDLVSTRIDGCRASVLERSDVSSNDSPPPLLIHLFSVLTSLHRFMNVLRSVRDIMEVLGVGDDFENHSVTSPGSDDSFGRQNIGGTASTHLLGLFYRLKPLLSMEKHLADRISASYMDDRNTGEQHLYVRRGWQSTPFTTADTLVPISSDGGRPSLDGDEVLSDVSAILLSLKDEIKALWGSPDVQQGLKRGRILLGETASTCVLFC